MRILIDFFPIALFVAAYKLHDIYTATAVLMAATLVQTGIIYAVDRKLQTMQKVTLVLVVVFGGLSVWLNDERFFKMKPTMIYLLFGVILGIGLLRGQSYLKLVMEEALPMQAEGWMILTRRLTAFFFALAIANEAVWRTLSTDAWVNFKTFGLTAALFLFFISQSGLLSRYAIEPETPPDT